MIALEDRIDIRKTRNEVQKHLKVLGKHMFRSQILDYISISSSVLSNSGNSSSAESGEKILNAMDKASKRNEDIQHYIEFILSGMNQLEKKQKDLLLAKYLYKLDDEEFQEEFHMSMRTIYNYMKEAEIDLAIILECAVYKEK